MAAAKKNEGARPAPPEAFVPAAERPIDQAKVLELIHKMVPGSKKAQTLHDGVTFMLSELNRLSIKISDLEKSVGQAPKAGGEQDPVLAAILRVEASQKQLKEQFSTMRQFGVGVGGGR